MNGILRGSLATGITAAAIAVCVVTLVNPSATNAATNPAPNATATTTSKATSTTAGATSKPVTASTTVAKSSVAATTSKAAPTTAPKAAPAVASSSTTTSKAVTASTAATPASTRILLSTDEFNGPAGSAPNPLLWTVLTGGSGWGNNELETYTNRASNVSLNGAGDLQITAKKESYTGSDGIARNWTSARLISNVPILYGYTEARIFLPAGQGFWPAFWTVGADVYSGVQWPVTGEIDIMESVNSMQKVSGTIHGPTTNNTAYQVSGSTSGSLAGSWHTYGINWTSTAITWYLDGVAYETVTKASMPSADIWEFSKPQLVQLNLAVGGTWPGSPDSTTPTSASMLVDYVRHYSN